MRCPCCWSDKAYVRRVGIGTRILLSCCLLIPVRCRHCCHKFVVLWFSTIGKNLQPPTRLRIDPIHRRTGPSHAAAMRDRDSSAGISIPKRPRRREAA